MTVDDSELVAVRLAHTIDLLRAEISSLRAEEAHHYEIISRRLASIEAIHADHETRLRSVSTGVTQFKVWSGLASGGSSVISVAALIRSIFGA